MHLLIFGAHPDDADYHAGGLAACYRRAGHDVTLISITNGEAGHHETYGPALVDRRRQEAARAAAVIGANYEVWDFPDGRLEPSLVARGQVIRTIRRIRPDLILAHRDNDYHPDHRAVAHLVRDASYLITVPAIEPDTDIVDTVPVFGYLLDRFTRPTAIRPDVVVDVDDCLESILEMLACHESQFFEWLPANRGLLDSVPADPSARREWLRPWIEESRRAAADRHRTELCAAYGADRASSTRFAEVFEMSEYGAPFDDDARRRLFPFIPSESA